jgi:hypothetical protein
VLPELAHTDVPPEQAWPQLPQLAAVLYATHSPLQRLKPAPHVKPQAPPETSPPSVITGVHAGVELATVVGQTFPQPLQLLGSVVGSVHAPEQTVGALDGHAATQAYMPLTTVHWGVSPPQGAQPPQLFTVVGVTQTPEHAIIPASGQTMGSSPPSTSPSSLPSFAASSEPGKASPPASSLDATCASVCTEPSDPA